MAPRRWAPDGGDGNDALRDGLRHELGVDVGGAEGEGPADGAAAHCSIDVGLDLEVGSDVVGGEGGVRVEVFDLSGVKDHVAGVLGGEEGLDVGMVGEVEVAVARGCRQRWR